MIKLKNILTEIMRQFDKSLYEDSDQNNNGYPDNTENYDLILSPEKLPFFIS